MFAVQEVTFSARDKKLAAIGVLAAIRHRQQARGVMFQSEVLIRERSTAIDTQHPGTVTIDEVAALYHEILDYSVENGTFEAQWYAILSVFPGAKLPEVLRCFRADVLEQLEDHATYLRSAHGHVEEHNRIVGVSQLRLNLSPSRHACLVGALIFT